MGARGFGAQGVNERGISMRAYLLTGDTTYLTPSAMARNTLAAEVAHLKALTADDEKSWRAFKRRFQAEMKTPEAMRDLDLLAALSRRTNWRLAVIVRMRPAVTARYCETCWFRGARTSSRTTLTGARTIE